MKKSRGLISVIIISFNGIEFIDDCLSSTIDSLGDSDFEIIVVDNGSIDGCVDFIKSHYPGVQPVLNDSNLGFARAVNQGLEIARGDFILLLNQDTKIVNMAIPRLVERMNRESRIGTIGPKFIWPDRKLQKSVRSFPRYRDLVYKLFGLSRLFPESKIFSNWKMGWFCHETEMEVDQPMGAALMIRRKAFEKVGFFDTNFRIFFNDVDYCRRVKTEGYINLYYPDAVVVHYVGGSTRKRKAAMILESHRSMYIYFKKYNKSVLTLPLLYFWGAVLFVSACFRAAVSRLFE